MNLTKVESILKLVNKAEISSIDYEDKEIKIFVKKNPYVMVENQSHREIPQTVSSIEPASNAANTKLNKSKIIKSDSVGIISFKVKDSKIKEGKVVSKGTPIFAIKAMNIEHEKKAEADCKILEFLVDDGLPVEYGQPIVSVNEI